MSSLTQEIANLVEASNVLTERVEGMLDGIDEHIDGRIDAALSQSNLTQIITTVINNLAASGQIGTNALTLAGHPVGDFVLKSDIIDMNPTPASSAVSEVFGATTYAGTGAVRALTTGQDLAQHGGVVHIKSRQVIRDHFLFHSARGALNSVQTNDGTPQNSANESLTAFSSNGFSVGAFAGGNAYGEAYIAWTFRNAPKFYGHKLVAKFSGAAATASFPELETLGMVRVKQVDGSGNWIVWHRSLPAGQLLTNNSSAPAAASASITVSGTTVTLSALSLGDGQYLVEAWAHDESASSMIKCGSFTTNSSGNATVTLGFEPQFLEIKGQNNGSDWFVLDSARGLGSVSNPVLTANTAQAEFSGTIATATATGFTPTGLTASSTYVYMAIRKAS